MTIFCSRLATDALCYSLELSVRRRYEAQSATKPSLRKDILKRHRDIWGWLFLLLDYAVEFPTIIVFHPAVSRYGINVKASLPTVWHLSIQVALCFVAEYMCCRHLPRIQSFLGFQSETDPSDGDSASWLATEYTTPRVALLLYLGAIAPLQSYWFLGGRLHFASIVVWIILRQSQARRRTISNINSCDARERKEY